MKGYSTLFMKLRNGSRGLLLAAFTAFAVFGAVPVARAQGRDLKPLLDRLDRMERDIRTLNLQLSRGGTINVTAAKVRKDKVRKDKGADSGRIFANFEVRLSAMEDELRNSIGRSEELGHRIDQISQRVDKLVGDVDYRLSVLENTGHATSDGNALSSAAASPNTSSVPLPSPGKTPGVLGTIAQSNVNRVKPVTTPPGDTGQAKAGQAKAGQAKAGQAKAGQAKVGQAKAGPAASPSSAILPPGSSKEQYTYARKLLLSQKFDQAEIVLREFIKVHPGDSLLSNARYWLGETYYVRGDFRSAAEVFMQGYKSAPKGSKAPDTLLKLGMSLSRLDKKQDACIAFTKLTDDFPKVSANISRIVSRERKSNNCN